MQKAPTENILRLRAVLNRTGLMVEETMPPIIGTAMRCIPAYKRAAAQRGDGVKCHKPYVQWSWGLARERTKWRRYARDDAKCALGRHFRCRRGRRSRLDEVSPGFGIW
jgi:hypothetical protein